MGGEHPLAVRAAVGVEEDRERTVPFAVAGGEQHDGGDLALPGPGERRPRGDYRTFCVRGDDGDLLALAQDAGPLPRPLQGRGDEDGDRSAARRAVHAGSGAHPLRPQFVDAQHVDLAGLRLLGAGPRRDLDQQVVGAHVQQAAHVEGVRGQRPVADGQHPRAALVGDPHQPPVGGPRGAPACRSSQRGSSSAWTIRVSPVAGSAAR